jgi:hypothetical protein
MSAVIIIGNRLIPSEQIALVEPFDRAANPRLRSDRDFQGRIVLINRDSVLTEDTPTAFAQANGFRMLEEDQVAANPAIAFRVETFEPGEGFSRRNPTSRACAGGTVTAMTRASFCLPKRKPRSPSWSKPSRMDKLLTAMPPHGFAGVGARLRHSSSNRDLRTSRITEPRPLDVRGSSCITAQYPVGPKRGGWRAG